MSKFKNSVIGRRVAGFAVGLALIAISATSVFATPIPLGGGGVVNVSNVSGTLLSVTSLPPCIAFSGITSPCSGTTAVLVSGIDPIFGTSGTIKDISGTPVTSFKTVNLTTGGGPAIWDLLNIITPSGFSACTTSTSSGACSTGTFVLTQSSPTQVSITLALNEIGYLGSSGTGSTPYIGIFTTQLSGTIAGCTGNNCAVTIGNLLLWEGAGHSISSTWSGTESPVSGVPEPMSLSMVGIGLLGLGLISRRRKKS